MNSTLVAVALGSNLGDRAAHLHYAARRLSAFLAHFQLSTFIDTAPVGMAADAPPFLNAAATGATTLTAEDLLAALLAIEHERGRERPSPAASRTLDLDLILFGDARIDRPGLVVPHPRFRERRFVLGPLAEIAPDLRDPITALTMGELLKRLPPALPAPGR